MLAADRFIDYFERLFAAISASSGAVAVLVIVALYGGSWHFAEPSYQAISPWRECFPIYHRQRRASPGGKLTRGVSGSRPRPMEAGAKLKAQTADNGSRNCRLASK